MQRLGLHPAAVTLFFGTLPKHARAAPPPPTFAPTVGPYQSCCSDDCCTVFVGPSSSRTITVPLPDTCAPRHVCPAFVNRWVWNSEDEFSDSFSVSVADGEVNVRRHDSRKGWGMDLGFDCCADCYPLIVGSSEENPVTSSIASTAFTCPSYVTQWNWISDQSNDAIFLVSQSATESADEVTVVTTREDDDRWWVNLGYECCTDPTKVFHPDEPRPTASPTATPTAEPTTYTSSTTTYTPSTTITTTAAFISAASTAGSTTDAPTTTAATTATITTTTATTTTTAFISAASTAGSTTDAPTTTAATTATITTTTATTTTTAFISAASTAGSTTAAPTTTATITATTTSTIDSTTTTTMAIIPTTSTAVRTADAPTTTATTTTTSRPYEAPPVLPPPTFAPTVGPYQSCCSDDCCTVFVGPSSSRTIIVPLPDTCGPRHVCPAFVNRWVWNTEDEYPDSFSVSVADGQVYVDRYDMNLGWGMDLGFDCCVDCYPLIVGSSEENPVTSSIASTTFTCPSYVTQWNWISDQSDDAIFLVSQSAIESADEVTVVTTREDDDRWWVNLGYECCADPAKVFHPDEPFPAPSTTPIEEPAATPTAEPTTYTSSATIYTRSTTTSTITTDSTTTDSTATATTTTITTASSTTTTIAPISTASTAGSTTDAPTSTATTAATFTFPIAATEVVMTTTKAGARTTSTTSAAPTSTEAATAATTPEPTPAPTPEGVGGPTTTEAAVMQTSYVHGGHTFHINEPEDFCNDTARVQAYLDAVVTGIQVAEGDIRLTHCSLLATDDDSGGENRMRRLQDDMQVVVQYTLELAGADWDELVRTTEEYEAVLNSTSIDDFAETFDHELSVATGESTESVGLRVVAKETVETVMPPEPTPAPTHVPTIDPTQEPGIPPDYSEAKETLMDEFFSDPNASATTYKLDGAIMVIQALEFGDEDVMEINIEGSEVAVSVPSDIPVEESAAIMVLVFTDEEDKSNALGNMADDGAALEEMVEIDLLSMASHGFVHVDNMTTPVLVKMRNMEPEFPACRYWNDTTRSWTTEGVWVVDEEEAFVCATSHLSTFSGFAMNPALLITCSNAALLNMEAIRRLITGEWWYAPGAWLVWAALAWHSYLLCASLRLDANPSYNSWRDEDFLTNDKTFHKKTGILQHLLDAFVHLSYIFERVKEHLMHTHSPLCVLVSDAMTWTLVYTASILGATRAGVMASDVHFLQRAMRSREHHREEIKRQRMQQAVLVSMTAFPSDSIDLNVVHLASGKHLPDGPGEAGSLAEDPLPPGSPPSTPSAVPPMEGEDTLEKRIPESRILLHPPMYLYYTTFSEVNERLIAGFSKPGKSAPESGHGADSTGTTLSGRGSWGQGGAAPSEASMNSSRRSITSRRSQGSQGSQGSAGRHRFLSRSLLPASLSVSTASLRPPPEDPKVVQDRLVTKLTQGRLRTHEEIAEQLEQMSRALWEDHANFFTEAGCSTQARRVYKLFLALQPWTSLLHSNATAPCAVRALLQMCRVFGSFLGAAWFYGSQSSDPDGPDECHPGSFVETLVLDVMIGVATSFVAVIPLTALKALHKRDITYVGSDEAFRRQLLKWWRLDVVLWVFSLCYIAFSFFFCLVFLANTSFDDSARWTVSAVVALFKNYVLLPAVISMAGVAAASAAVLMPGIKERTEARLPRVAGSMTPSSEKTRTLSKSVTTKEFDPARMRGDGMGPSETLAVEAKVQEQEDAGSELRCAQEQAPYVTEILDAWPVLGERTVRRIIGHINVDLPADSPDAGSADGSSSSQQQQQQGPPHQHGNGAEARRSAMSKASAVRAELRRTAVVSSVLEKL